MPAALARIDPLVRLLVLAILLASLVPVTGAGRPIAQGISNGAVFLLFLLNGLRLPRADVLRGIGHVRFLAPLVLWCFGAMALAGWGLSVTLDGWLPPLVALGFLYLGTLPSTVQSATAYSSLAGGNIANSVVAAALLNILGVFVTAPLFSAMAGSGAAPFDLDALQRVAMILLLPFVLGQLAQNRFGHLVREHRSLATWMDRTAIAIAVYVAFSGAVEEGLWSRVSPGEWGVLLGAVMVFLAIGFVGAWLLAGALALRREDRIAFLFSGGQKSIAMGAPLAAVLFPPGTAGLVLLPVLVYHLLQLVLSAPLASRLARAARPDLPSADCGESTTRGTGR
jgi:solute carrier family 10 (sodium/bile acid cotransporter), member 7